MRINLSLSCTNKNTKISLKSWVEFFFSFAHGKWFLLRESYPTGKSFMAQFRSSWVNNSDLWFVMQRRMLFGSTCFAFQKTNTFRLTRWVSGCSCKQLNRCESSNNVCCGVSRDTGVSIEFGFFAWKITKLYRIGFVYGSDKSFVELSLSTGNRALFYYDISLKVSFLNIVYWLNSVQFVTLFVCLVFLPSFFLLSFFVQSSLNQTLNK